MQTIKKGSRGEAVKTLQQALHLKVDGIFGVLTEESVKDFQKANGLIADGIVGPNTWNKILGSTILKSKRVINDIILHCSATPEGKDYTTADIKRWHLDRGFSDIGYHYVIYRDGSVHTGRDINVSGAHCTNHNSHSIGICYIGGLDNVAGIPVDKQAPKDTRTVEQKKAMVKLVKDLLATYKLNMNNVHCHYQYAQKACPSFKIETFKNEMNTI